jgi:hypothetical protein
MTRKKNRNKQKPVAKPKTATLKVTPVQGDSTETVVKVAKGATVGGALQQAGISVERKNVTVDGKPADLSAPLAAGQTVTVEERPQGS